MHLRLGLFIVTGHCLFNDLLMDKLQLAGFTEQGELCTMAGVTQSIKPKPSQVPYNLEHSRQSFGVHDPLNIVFCYCYQVGAFLLFNFGSKFSSVSNLRMITTEGARRVT